MKLTCVFFLFFQFAMLSWAKSRVALNQELMSIYQQRFFKHVDWEYVFILLCKVPDLEHA
jgi:hypothetical protein